MSRTDAHVPFFVRVSRGDVSFIEAHDHRDGVCDLPAPLSSNTAPLPEPPKAAKPAQKANPHKLGKAEALVAGIEAQLADIEAQLADPAVYADGAKVASLGQRQAALREQLDSAESELLALYG